MKTPPLMDIEAANVALGRADGPRLREVAEQALAEGYDSIALRRLAGLSEPSTEEAVAWFKQAFAELGGPLPSQREAVLRLARVSATQILSGVLSPYDGGKQIWDLTLISGQVAPELDPFVYAASEWEDRPEDRPMFERAIKDAARELAGGA